MLFRVLAFLSTFWLTVCVGNGQPLLPPLPESPLAARSDDPPADPSAAGPGGGQTTPGPEDRGHGPRFPEGEDGGSNAAIGRGLLNLYNAFCLVGLVVGLLILANR